MRYLLLLLSACAVETPVTPATGLQMKLTEGAQSYELFVLAQKTRSGGTIDCRDLMSGAVSVGDPDFEILVGPAVGKTSDAVRIAGLPPGSDNRVLFVSLLDGPDGTGRILAQGCKAAVSVRPGQTSDETVSFTLL